MSLAKLLFDETNPRIADRLGKRPPQRQIRELLLGEMEARELVPSFIANGYLPYEPMIVRPERDGKYVVMEGNRRLAALLSMRESDDREESKAFEERRLSTVPVVVFEGDSRQELAYLGLRHVSKTKDWSASAKAAFVERMLRSGLDLSEAARLTNTTRHALRQMLLVRRLFEKAGALGIELPTTSAEGDVAFWHLGDASRRSNTKQYLGITESEDPLQPPSLDEGHFENLLGWLYGNPKTRQPKLISSIRDIPALDRCLGHPKSAEALEAGASLSEALEEAEVAGAKVTAHLERAKTSVQRATGGLSDVDASGRADVKQARVSLGRAVKAFDEQLTSSNS